MALQGRKPGWLLDKVLGREPTEEDQPAVIPPALPPHAEVPAPGGPRSTQDGGASFEAPLRGAPQDEEVVGLEAAPTGAPDLAPSIDILAGAALQPIDPPPTTPAQAPRPVPPPLPPSLPAVEPLPASLPSAEAAPEPRQNWFRRLTEGMRRTSSVLGEGVTGLFTKAKLDRSTLDDLEDLLISADLGVETASRITGALSSSRYERGIAPSEVRAIMASEIERVLAPVARPLEVVSGTKPFVLLMIGVNGAGKTTTIGKLAQKFRRQGLAVTIAAGDTFRAAAIEQLKVWGERVGAPVIARAQGSDAAGLAFDALAEARASGADVLMIDTAGRLQNKTGLMAELEKIIRVVRKIDATAPHATLLVLDATVGQNAMSQVELFAKTAGVTGLVMTKLDGTARGGILVALAARFGLPIHFIGVGEGVEDLEPFTAADFARAIAGLDEAA